MDPGVPYSVEDVVRFFIPPVLLRVDVWILIASFVVSPRKTYLAASVLACAFFAYRSQLAHAAPLTSWQLGGALLAVLCAAGLVRNLLCAHRRSAADVARGRARSRSFRFKGSRAGPPGDNPAAVYSYNAAHDAAARAVGAGAPAAAAAPAPAQAAVVQEPSPAPRTAVASGGAGVTPQRPTAAPVDARTTNGAGSGAEHRPNRDRTSSRNRHRTSSRGSASARTASESVNGASRRLDAHRAMAAAATDEAKTEERSTAAAASPAADGAAEPPVRKAVTVPPSDLPLRMPMGPPTQGEHCFSLLDGSTFDVRGLKYVNDGVKVRAAVGCVARRRLACEVPAHVTCDWWRRLALALSRRWRHCHHWLISYTWICSRRVTRSLAWRHTLTGMCRRRLRGATRASSSRSRSR